MDQLIATLLRKGWDVTFRIDDRCRCFRIDVIERVEHCTSSRRRAVDASVPLEMPDRLEKALRKIVRRIEALDRETAETQR